MKRILQAVIFLVLVPIILFQFRGLSPAGGDSGWIVALVERPLYFFFRAPLVTAFHKFLWWNLRDYGWTAGDCVSLSSSIAGGFFYLALFRLSARWRVWTPMLCGCIPLIFIGHQETYAWPFALSLWTLHLLREYVEERMSSVPLFTVLVLATFAHPMTLMVWPGVAWALRPWSQDKLKPLLIALVATVFLMIVFLLFGKAGGFPQRKWILPLFEVGNTLTRYPFFSWEHWKELGWFYLISMPLGAILIVALGVSEWRGWLGGLHVTVLVTLTWSLIWHPGMSYHDWDLFAWPALFVNLAAGFAWKRRQEHAESESGPKKSESPQSA